MSDKKSWREIDQMKDRSLKPSKKKSQLETRAEKLASKQARQELDQLFNSSKLSKEKVRRLDEIKSKRGTSTFYDAISKYCHEFGIPREWEAQLLVLDHRDSGLVIEMLEHLKKTAPTENLEKQSLLAQKLRVMEVSSFDPDLVRKIRELKELLLIKN